MSANKISISPTLKTVSYTHLDVYKRQDDIRFGLEQGINFIAISFVRTAKDVQEVRAICEETGNGHVQLLAKDVYKRQG